METTGKKHNIHSQTVAITSQCHNSRHFGRIDTMLWTGAIIVLLIPMPYAPHNWTLIMCKQAHAFGAIYYMHKRQPIHTDIIHFFSNIFCRLAFNLRYDGRAYKENQTTIFIYMYITWNIIVHHMCAICWLRFRAIFGEMRHALKPIYNAYKDIIAKESI